VLAIIDYALLWPRSETVGVDYFVDLLVKAILAAPDKRLPIVFDERDYAREYRRGEFSFSQNLEGLSIKWTEE